MTETFASLATRHLTALGRPEEAAAYLETVAPEFLVVLGGQAVLARDATPGKLAASWEAVPPSVTPRFGDPEEATWRPVGSDGALWLAVLPERTTGARFQAAFGFEWVATPAVGAEGGTATGSTSGKRPVSNPATRDAKADGTHDAKADGTHDAKADGTHDAATATANEPGNAAGNLAGNVAGTWRIAWAGLYEGEPRPPALQQTLALAELASLEPLAPLGPFASLLDVAFARLARLPDVPLSYLPETRFACHGTGVCCSQALTIPLEPHAARFISAVPWPDLDPGVGAGPYVWEVASDEVRELGFAHVLAHREDGSCHLLRDDRRCAVHSLLGRAVLTPCHVFPYSFAWTPAGVCVTVHHLCPSVREQQGPEPRERDRDVRSRLAIAALIRTDTFRLNADREVSWKVFEAAETAALEILGASAPLREKLWRALGHLGTLLDAPGLSDGVVPPPDLAPPVQIPPVPPEGWAVAERLAERFDRYFFRVEGLPGGGPDLETMEPVLTRWFRSLVFGKTLTYAHGLMAGLNALALVYRVVERQVRRWEAEGSPPPALWNDLFTVVTPGAGAFQKDIAALYRENGGAIGSLAQSPLLGQNLLRPLAS